MKKLFLAIAGGSLLGSSTLPAVVVATVGTYDPNPASPALANNSVDTEASGNSSTVGTFTTAVASAFTAGFGGVAGFDAATFTADSNLDLTYAAGTKTLRISSSVQFNTSTLTTTSSAAPLSGTNILNRATAASSDTTFTFGPITGGAPSEFVTSFAFTILSRNTYTANGSEGGTAEPKTFTATAYFSDGTSASATSTIDPSRGGDDTFYSFAAPSGHSISSVFVDALTNGTSSRYQPLFDDVAFITTAGVIPEPSSMLLVAAGAATLLRRRRD